MTAPGLHAPALQASPLVQALPSSHPLVKALNTHPFWASQPSSVQGLPSLQVALEPALHLPPWQLSPWVQALPSLQGAATLPWTQPVLGSQLSVVQGLASSQPSGAPDWQLPAAQASPLVQALPSLQEPDWAANTHPALGSQLSAVQALLSVQTASLPGMQVPFWQASAWVQASLSLQAPVVAACRQPWLGAQLSAVHGLASSQSAALPGKHLPATQASSLVQALPSLQNWPPGMVTQPFCLSQVVVVHTPVSLQTTAVPAWHTPPWQESPLVQASLSSQAPAAGLAVQPSFVSQLSAVHGLLSSQATAVPLVHLPAWQLSPLVQASPSSQPPWPLLNWQPLRGSQLSRVHVLLSLQATATWPAHLPL